MNAVGERSLASFVRVILDGAWWLGVVSLALLLLVFVLGLIVSVEGGNLTMSLPVAVELAAPVQGQDAPADARFEQLHGNLRFPMQKGLFFFSNMLLILLFLVYLLWVLAQLRHVFRSLSRRLLFVPQNAQRVRWVGYAVVFGELVRVGLVYYWSHYASLHFTASGLRFVPTVDLNVMTILAGLAILVLAEVFREGARLHEDHSLTI